MTVPTTGRCAYPLALLGLLAVFSWLYLAQLFSIEDPNAETSYPLLILGHLERAREKSMTPAHYFHQDAFWQNYKEQDHGGAYSCLNKRYMPEFFAYSQPVLHLLYLPFVKIMGVCAKTLAVYSTFFTFLAWISMGFLAFKMFGRWCAVLSMLILMTSLSWLIHVKAANSHWMPSVCLMNGLALCLLAYMKKPGAILLGTIGVILGIMCMLGWITIVFGVLIAGIVVIIWRQKPFSQFALGIGWMIGLGLLTVNAITFAFTLRYNCATHDIYSALWDDKVVRFTQGGTPHNPLSIIGKIAYGFRCMFWDMTTFDHPDKYLEGYPAIPWLFALFLFIGIFFAIRNRTIENKLLLIWLFSVVGFLSVVFAFAHRYALLVMPAMSILAAQGILCLGSDLARRPSKLALKTFTGLTIFSFMTVIADVRYNYYHQYTLHKPPNLEVDRMRGHSKVMAWLRENCEPKTTLIVLNDPIMFPSACLYFLTFDHEYRFVFWSNYFGKGGTSAQVKAWEKDAFRKYSKIVFVLSTTIFPDADPRSFLAAHPGIQPKFTYAYADREASIFVFEVGKESK